MPRKGRLDVPGAIHHVIVRGLERREIFRDDNDRGEFVRRLARALKETGTQCYGWVLIPNHFHLVIRTGQTPLSGLMRKLQSGYAIYFNRRHRRNGYLFQNRYKSVLCQEDAYLLELVRYVHLNPVRARLVKGLDELVVYPWSGHSVLMGHREAEWQEARGLLAWFGEELGDARERYLLFVKEGLGQGRRRDLAGGGLRRSAGGWEGVKMLKREREAWQGDGRILGDGDFVEAAIKAGEESVSRREKLKREGWNLSKLVRHVCEIKKVEEYAVLRRRGRKNEVSQARALVAYWGTRELGVSGAEIARYFGISRSSVSEAVVRGEGIAREGGLNLIP